MTQKLKTRAAQLSIGSNLALIVLKLTAGIAMHSVSVISEAVTRPSTSWLQSLLIFPFANLASRRMRPIASGMARLRMWRR